MSMRSLSLFLAAASLGCAAGSHSRPENFQGYVTATAPGPGWEVDEGLLIVDIEEGGRSVKTFRAVNEAADAQIEAIARPGKLSEPELQAEIEAAKRRREGCAITQVRTNADRSRAGFAYNCTGAENAWIRIAYLRPPDASRGLIEIEGLPGKSGAAEMEKAIEAFVDSIRLVSPRK